MGTYPGMGTCPRHYSNNIHVHVHVHIRLSFELIIIVGGEGKTGKAVILKDWNESSFVSDALLLHTHTLCIYVVLDVNVRHDNAFFLCPIEKCSRCDLDCYRQDHQVSFRS